MSKPKLFVVLEVLELKEWVSLKKYLFMFTEHGANGNKLIDLLFAERNNDTGFPSSDVIRTSYFKQMSQKSFANMCSRMFLLFEEWTAFYQLKEERYLSDLMKHKFYNRRGLFKFANKTATQIEQKIEGNQTWDLEKDKVRSQLMHQQYYSDNPIKYVQGSKILKDLISAYASSVHCQSLFYICELYNWGGIQSYDFGAEIEMLDQAIINLPQNDLSIAIRQLRNMIQNSDPTELSTLANYLYENKIDKQSDLHVIFCLYLIVISLRFWSAGKMKDITELSRLYNYALESGVLMIDGKIPIARFYYIIGIISITNTFEYAKDFIDLWYGKVNSKYLQTVKLVAYAQNCAYNEKEDEILPYLRAIRHVDDGMKMRVGVFTLMSMYKNREEDLFLLKIQIKNFKSQLKRIKSSEHQKYKKGAINFVKVLDQLIRRDRKELVIDLNQYDDIIFRAWLNKQLSKK